MSGAYGDSPAPSTADRGAEETPSRRASAAIQVAGDNPYRPTCPLGQNLRFAGSRERAICANCPLPILESEAQDTLDLIGQVFSHSMAHEKAAQAYRSACALAPAHAAHRYNLVTALIALGDVDAAELELERCLAIDPLFWRAHLTSAHLRRRSETDNHVERLAALLSRHAGDPLPAILRNAAVSPSGDYAIGVDDDNRLTRLDTKTGETLPVADAAGMCMVSS